MKKAYFILFTSFYLTLLNKLNNHVENTSDSSVGSCNRTYHSAVPKTFTPIATPPSLYLPIFPHAKIDGVRFHYYNSACPHSFVIGKIKSIRSLFHQKLNHDDLARDHRAVKRCSSEVVLSINIRSRVDAWLCWWLSDKYRQGILGRSFVDEIKL